MSDLIQALLKGVLETCRRHLPDEDVAWVHTLEHAVETALAYSAASLSISDEECTQYSAAVCAAMDDWLSSLPEPAAGGGRTFSGAAPGGAPGERVDALRRAAVEAIAEARASAPDERAALGDLLHRLSELDSTLTGALGERSRAFLARDYDPGDGLIDPAMAEVVFRRIFPDHPELKVENLTPLTGLHSREVHFLDIVDGGDWRRSLVIRRDRRANLTPGSVADEYDVLRLLHDAGLPVPRAVAASRDPEDLGRPFVAMERVDARTLDLGTDPAADQRMLELAELLARYHSVPLSGLPAGGPTGEGGLRSHYLDTVIPYWEAGWRALGTHSFVMERALDRLRDFPAGAGEDFHLIHGDYTARQVLADQDRVVALLDFELAGPGSPAEDLVCIKSEVESVLPWPLFLERYHAAGGVRLSQEVLDYFDVFIQFRNVIIVSRGPDGFRRGAVDDIHFGVMGVTLTPFLLDQLHRTLEALQNRVA